MSRDSLLQHALALSPEERVQLIDDLLVSIVDSNGAADLTAEQQTELLQRLAAHRADPSAAISWEDAEAQITQSK